MLGRSTPNGAPVNTSSPFPVAWKIYDDYAIKNSASVCQLSSDNVRKAKINKFGPSREKWKHVHGALLIINHNLK